MLRKYLLPAFAVGGTLIALFVVYQSEKTEKSPSIPFLPAQSPYKHTIFGAGIIEASSRNLSIGSPFSEIVTKVFVTEGDRVKVGDLLFQLDLRSFEAQLETACNRLVEAIVSFENQKTQFSFFERLSDKRAVSE